MSSFVVTLVVLGLASPCWAGRLSPDQAEAGAADVLMPSLKHGQPVAAGASDADGSVDFADGDDPSVRSHWALLIAGSAGWGNYRHQADVFHAYQVLVSGGYHPDHIVVMAYDDIANNPENPMPGKVFNRPGGPDVYAGVRIDYKGEDVNSATFLAVLEGDAAAVANKGSGRVIASGPRDKVFLFYSDHGAAGVVGMPSGPFLYADELMATLRKKFEKHGFKELVMYIEACESGSMFEGLLDSNMAAYVTTAANAYESSWATYCPEFFAAPAADTAATAAGTNVQHPIPNNFLTSETLVTGPAVGSSSVGTWLLQLLLEGLLYAQRLLTAFFGTAQQQQSSASTAAASSNPQQQQQGLQGQPPAPQFFTCLGDLYSVAWMEDAEVADLTKETLLQQYKAVKSRTSQNFTYEQGSHVMQYGALDIDKELAGDYEGMRHNGSAPPSPSFPSVEWTQFEEQQVLRQQMRQGSRSGSAAPAASLLQQQYSSTAVLAARLSARGDRAQQQQQHSSRARTPTTTSVLQRDADLLPLLHASQRSTCPRRRAAAAAALRSAMAARQSLEAAVRAATAALIKHPDVGHILLANMGWSAREVLPAAHPAALQALYAVPGDEGDSRATGKQQQLLVQERGEAALAQLEVAAHGSGSSGGFGNDRLLGDVAGGFIEALMSPLPGFEGWPLVDSWDCLRGMVQAWEGRCGQLDQYAMKQTRLFANLCNAGVEPRALAAVLPAVQCSAA